MRVVFLGTPAFALPSLEMLVREGYEIVCVFTQPDRRKDRGQKTTPSVVKQAALSFGIPVCQFDRVRSPEAVQALRAARPDVMVTVAFGQILSQENLDIPPLGCINVHASLLPAYRGAAPVEWVLINGEEQTGVTTMYTDAGLDTGDMILREHTPIGAEETGAELSGRLALLGARVLGRTLRLVEAGKAPREKQDEALASYYPMLKKETGRIDWRWEPERIRNLCRALDGSMGAYTFLDGEKMKIFKAETVGTRAAGECGEVIVSSPREGLAVRAGSGALRLLELQMPGGRRVPAADLLRGRSIPTGTALGR